MGVNLPLTLRKINLRWKTGPKSTLLRSNYRPVTAIALSITNPLGIAFSSEFSVFSPVRTSQCYARGRLLDKIQLKISLLWHKHEFLNIK